MTFSYDYAVIGAGLAGSELAYQLSQTGARVLLLEMRPRKTSGAHHSADFAELVCSNSFRSSNPHNAVGLIKEEMAALGSLIMTAAAAARVPAGDAFAVDRDLFSKQVTAALHAISNLTIRHGEVAAFESLPNGVRIFTDDGTLEVGRAICATGPLTSAPLYHFLTELFSKESLYFYDSIAPIVHADSIDMNIAYAASRYGKGEAEGHGQDYLNCPMDRETYERFIDAMLAAEKMPIHEIDRPIFFEACLPIEVMAERGRETLRFGPMKPVGLVDPRTGAPAHAVVQLRIENRERTCYNLVGFQTRMKQAEQKRIFSMIPGLEQAEFLRYGAMHRNTYLESPSVLGDQLESPAIPHLHFAGQMTGVEGYVESAATGLLLGHLLPRFDRTGTWAPPPKTTALGALYAHLREPLTGPYSPNNVHFGLFPALSDRVKKNARKEAMVARARHDFATWMIG